MPLHPMHTDANGTPLKAGDRVTLDCEVMAIDPNPDVPNLMVRVVRPDGHGNPGRPLNVHAAQVVKAAAAE